MGACAVTVFRIPALEPYVVEDNGAIVWQRCTRPTGDDHECGYRFRVRAIDAPDAETAKAMLQRMLEIAYPRDEVPL